MFMLQHRGRGKTGKKAVVEASSGPGPALEYFSDDRNGSSVEGVANTAPTRADRPLRLFKRVHSVNSATYVALCTRERVERTGCLMDFTSAVCAQNAALRRTRRAVKSAADGHGLRLVIAHRVVADRCRR